jgi:ABC-type Mn2+/Zn2+ transport system ATPase subunit
LKKEIISDEPARLEISHINVGYNDKNILEDISFTVQHGDQIAIVGPNGAGKSTLFKALVGLLPVRSGFIRIHGHPLGQHQDCVAYVPQREDVDLKFPVTVLDVTMMGRFGKLGLFGRPSLKDKQIVLESLNLMGIADLAHLSISELSGGQLQRVFLARALAQEPHILLMDEPFTGVDITTQEKTMELLETLQKQGVTVMVSTHDLTMASERFDQTMLLNHRIIAFGKPEQVFTHDHIHEAFSGKVLFLDGAAVVDQCCSGEESGGH